LIATGIACFSRRHFGDGTSCAIAKTQPLPALVPARNGPSPAAPLCRSGGAHCCPWHPRI